MKREEIWEMVESVSFQNLQKILAILLDSPLGRLIETLVFEGEGETDISPVPTIKEKESEIGDIGLLGEALVTTQYKLLAEKELLEKAIASEKNVVKRREQEIRHAIIERERDVHSLLLRLIVDKVGGTASFRIKDIAIKNGNKLVRTDSSDLLFPSFN